MVGTPYTKRSPWSADTRCRYPRRSVTARESTAAVGLISDPVIANSILEAGQADLIVLGRIMLWDPYWPHHAAAVLGADSRLPVQYERSGIHAPDRYSDPNADTE